MPSAPSHRQLQTRTRVVLVALVITLMAAAVAFSSRSVSSQDSDPQRDLERVFWRHDRLALDPGQIDRQVKQTHSLRLPTSRGTFELTLTPRDMRAPGYRAEAWADTGVRVLERTPVRTYKGTVAGMPAAQARFTIDENTVEGLIITSDEVFFLEPVRNYSRTAPRTDFVFYSESDVKEPAGECGVTMAEMIAQHSTSVSKQTSVKVPQPEAAFGPALEIGISLEADFEYVSMFGSGMAAEDAARAQIESIMNSVEGIYNVQIGLQFLLLHTRMWSTAGDPYNQSAPSALLNEFRTSYNSSAPAQAAGRDLAHLFTGRDLDGSTIGIAYLPGLQCPFDPQGLGYGISQHISGNRAGLTAHEIGHNLRAAHVSSTQGGDCTSSIMTPFISASTNFCQFSRDEITDHAIATRDCLTPLTQPGCNYSISPTSQSFPASGISGLVTVTTTAGCNWGVAEAVPWLSPSPASGSGSGTVIYTAGANSCGPRTALVSIAGHIHTVQQDGAPLTDPANAVPISFGQTANGVLSSTDCPTGLPGRPGAFMDRYKFNGIAGQNIRIEMNAAVPPQSGGLDTYLYLYAPDGSLVAQNDDIQLGVETNSRIPCTNVSGAPCALEGFTLPQTGTYIIVATSFSNGETGAYSLALLTVQLLTEEGSVSAAAALDSVTFVRGPFKINNPNNFSSDQITRLILFTSDLGLAQEQNPSPSLLSVRAEGAELVVENVGPFSFAGLNGSYLIVALKRRDGNPMLTGNLALTVTCRNLTSNLTNVTISP